MIWLIQPTVELAESLANRRRSGLDRQASSALNFMGQVKVFGLREQLDAIKQQLSDVIHSCVMDALRYPADHVGP